jgi:hypothetical protein
MKTVSIRRKILFLLLVLVLATPWALVAGPERERPRTMQGIELAVPEIFGRIWSFLWRGGSKEGCHIDPNGRCVPEPKEGCNIDPFGRCLPLQPKIGCHIDPDGRCLQPKAGCNIDPDGHCIP